MNTKDNRKIKFRIMDGFGVATIAIIKIKVYMYFLISLRLETIRLIKSVNIGIYFG